MSEQNLKTMAEELEELLAHVPVEAPAPIVDESYSLAADTTQSPEAMAAEEQEDLLPELIRSIFEYAVKRSPATASPRHIGEAIGEGVFAAVDQLKLDDVKTVEAVEAFLGELCEAVRNTLSME